MIKKIEDEENTQDYERKIETKKSKRGKKKRVMED